VGPLLLKSLVAQDMFLAGTIVLLLGVMTVIGTFISDLLLMWIDPASGSRGSNERARGPACRPAADEEAALPFRSPRSASPSPPSGSSCVAVQEAPAGHGEHCRGASLLSGGDLRRLSCLLGPARLGGAAVAPAAAAIHWFDEGRFSPHVFGLTGMRDPNTFKRVYTPDPAKKIPVRFFVRGFEYRPFGLIR